MRVIRGGKYDGPPKLKIPKALAVPKIEVEGMADKFENWLQDKAKEVEANKPNDRYFVAYVDIYLPIASHKAWPTSIRDTLCFEQPDYPSVDEIEVTGHKAWRIARKVVFLSIQELTEADYMNFLGDESGWQVIDE